MWVIEVDNPPADNFFLPAGQAAVRCFLKVWLKNPPRGAKGRCEDTFFRAHLICGKNKDTTATLTIKGQDDFQRVVRIMTP